MSDYYCPRNVLLQCTPGFMNTVCKGLRDIPSLVSCRDCIRAHLKEQYEAQLPHSCRQPCRSKSQEQLRKKIDVWYKEWIKSGRMLESSSSTTKRQAKDQDFFVTDDDLSTMDTAVLQALKDLKRPGGVPLEDLCKYIRMFYRFASTPIFAPPLLHLVLPVLVRSSLRFLVQKGEVWKESTKFILVRVVSTEKEHVPSTIPIVPNSKTIYAPLVPSKPIEMILAATITSNDEHGSSPSTSRAVPTTEAVTTLTAPPATSSPAKGQVKTAAVFRAQRRPRAGISRTVSVRTYSTTSSMVQDETPSISLFPQHETSKRKTVPEEEAKTCKKRSVELSLHSSTKTSSVIPLEGLDESPA